MFSLPVRLFIVVTAAAYGIYKLVNGEQSGYIFLALAGIFTLGYFRYGAIRPAYMAMRRGNLDAARKHVETIRFPKLLSAESRAYLHWVNGVIAADVSGNMPYAEDQVRLAISGKLRTSNDRCIATATLARIVARNNDLESARDILGQAERIPHTDNVTAYLNELRSEFEKAR